MKVVVPHTRISPGVREGLKSTGRKWEEVFVGNSDEDYWGVLAVLWAKRETFCVVEHDVLVRHDTLDELENCPEAMCAFPVPYFWSPVAVSLACVKFSAEVIARHPDLMQRVGEMSDEGHPPRHWCRLDMWIQMLIRPDAFHAHYPVLEHYRPDGALPYPSHGCVKP